jgi:hypothetical protein
MTRQDIATHWNATLTTLEARYVGGVLNILLFQYVRFAFILRNDGPEAAKAHILSDYINARIGKLIQKLYLEVGIFMADRTSGALGPTRKQKAATHPLSSHIEEYFKLHLLNKTVFTIGQTTRKELLLILQNGQRTGASVDQMVREAERLEPIQNRARTIVRTEVNRAANYGIYLGAISHDYYTTKTWAEVHDNRTRLSHRHSSGVGGEKVDTEQPFSNGLMFPGDPEGSPEETIKCRCRMIIKAKRDERGRPIKKNPVLNNIPVTDRRSTGISAALRAIENLVNTR